MSDFRMLRDANRSDVGDGAGGGEREIVRRERRITAWVLFGIAIFTLGDLIEDRFDGAPWSHVLAELGIVCLASVLGMYLIRRSRAPLIRKSQRLERELASAQADAKKWRVEARQLIDGLSHAIAKQLDEWSLSEAEKEIAMLLLKGLSHKEIAAVRETSEQTVRQQAASVYQKSGLSGRTELSAFFLEDLLVNPGIKTNVR